MKLGILAGKFSRNLKEKGLTAALKKGGRYAMVIFKRKWFVLDAENGIKLYFDRGKLALYRQGRELTRGLGLHTVFDINGRRYDSSSGSWEFKQITASKLFVNIKYGDSGVSQNFLFTVTGNELSWEVEMDLREPLRIQNRKTGIFVCDKYTRWFNASEEGEFPQGFNWDNIALERKDSRVFGVKPGAGFPGIMFEAESRGQPLLQNTNENIGGRSIQFQLTGNEAACYQPGTYKYCSCRIKLIYDSGFIDAYIQEQAKIRLDSLTLQRGCLRILLDKGKIKIFHGDVELTKGLGMHMAFYIGDKWYDSSVASWDLKKIDADKFYINLKYADIAVRQNLLLELRSPNEISWESAIQVESALRIEKQKAGLFVSPEYNNWFSAGESGEFPRGFNWERIALQEAGSRSFGVNVSGRYPAIFLEMDWQGKPLLENTDEQISARSLQFELKQNEGGTYYEPGSYKYCSGRIKVAADADTVNKYIQEQAEKLSESKTLSNENLALLFDKGKARIYWRMMQITKGFGMHTAFKIEDKWYDSACGEWECEKLDRHKFKVMVRYKEILTQDWLITLKSSQIRWEVKMKIDRPLRVEQSKAGIFVDDKYLCWFNSGEQGEFPRAFGWDKVFLNELDSRSLGVKPSAGLPGILFEADLEVSPSLQNTNQEITARSLQFEIKNASDRSYGPGDYEYFCGTINLIEDERTIDEHISGCKLLPQENEPVYIFGDTEELHNRIAQESNFKERLIKLKQSVAQNKKTSLKVGVSRLNFFRIKEIVEFTLSLAATRADLSRISLEVFPVQKLYYNFLNYLRQIKSRIKGTGLELVSIDEELFELLSVISSKSNPSSDRKLLRLLGVIAEHAFIGPQTVVIDPHHRCNVNCLHCWVHTPKIKHAPEFLDRKFDYDLYKLMIDDFSDLMVDTVIFQGDGEPLLYDKFFDMVKYARGKNIAASFFTNGTLLDKRIAQEAVEIGVTQIFCSLPAGTENTYALVTNRKETGALAGVLSNLKNLSALKRQANKANPQLIMTHVIHNLNYHEIEQMAQNDMEVGADIIRFYIIRLDDNNRFLQLKPQDVEAIKKSMANVKAYLSDKPAELLDTTDFQLEHYEKNSGAWSKGVFLNEGCLLGWFFCLVPALGDISLCCHLRTVGYLKEKRFKDIWNSQEYSRYRLQAKYLKKNKDATFLNGVKLYDEHCEHCDTHQVIRNIREGLRFYNLERFIAA